jgi:flagellar assembly protein FliH
MATGFASFTADNEARMTVQKFQFDDFDVEEPSVRAEPKLLLSEAEELQGQAKDVGHAEGMAAAHASIEAEAIEAFAAIQASLAEVEAAQAAIQHQIYEEAVRLAMTVVRKVLPVWAAKQSLSEIEGLILTCFKERHEEARIVIRLPDALLDPVQSRLNALVAESGFAGKPVLLADPSLKVAEARVEWANGGAEWNYEAQLHAIEAVAHQLANPKTSKPAPPIPSKENIE